MSKNLVINKEKCISCGLCIKDCISNALEFDENKTPKFAKSGENRCIECQHCLSICPTGALSILDKLPENSNPIEEQNPDAILNTIKSRRSTRLFKNENISPELMDELKSALNYVPTGCNDHNLLFSITETREETNKIREYVITNLSRALRFLPFAGPAKKFKHYKKLLINKVDVIYRNAPHIIVAASPKNAPCKNIDPNIALSYFELYANSLGIGTCWCGFGQACFKIFPKLKKIFNIPKDYEPVYVMLFGLPDVKYTRTTQPEPYKFVKPDTSLI